MKATHGPTGALPRRRTGVGEAFDRDGHFGATTQARTSAAAACVDRRINADDCHAIGTGAQSGVRAAPTVSRTRPSPTVGRPGSTRRTKAGVAEPGGRGAICAGLERPGQARRCAERSADSCCAGQEGGQAGPAVNGPSHAWPTRLAKEYCESETQEHWRGVQCKKYLVAF